TAASAVGGYPITATGQTSGNYTIGYLAGTLTVTKASLTVTADDKRKTYGTVKTVVAVTYGRVVHGDSAAIPGVTVTVTATVTKASLTITANSDSKTYGTVKTFAATAFSQVGLVNSDTITGVTETSTGAAASAVVTPPTYPIVASAATGTGLSNYTIIYSDGARTVNKATLTVTANSDRQTERSVKSLPATALSRVG